VNAFNILSNYPIAIFPQVKMKDLKFYYIEDDSSSTFTSPVCGELQSAMRSVVSHLKLAHNISATKLVMKNLRLTVPAYISALGGEKNAATFSQELALKKVGISQYGELTCRYF